MKPPLLGILLILVVVVVVVFIPLLFAMGRAIDWWDVLICKIFGHTWLDKTICARCGDIKKDDPP